MNFFKKLLSDESAQASHWQRDEDAPVCSGCHEAFTLSNRRHHCRNCGYVFCAQCSSRQCTVPMRNIHTKVRVCNDCYVSLTGRRINGARPSEVPSDSRAPSTRPGDAPSGSTANLATSPSAPGGSGVEGGPAQPRNMPASATDTTGAATSQTPATAAATTAASAHEAAREDSAEAPEVGGVYQHVYGAHDGSENASVAISSEQAEKELLARRWAQVRKDAQFVDILIQRVERVEVDTPVEYSRETETITLQPEMPVTELARTLMPLPLPIESSARFLLDPVQPILLSEVNDREDTTADNGASGEMAARGAAMRARLGKQLRLVSTFV